MKTTTNTTHSEIINIALSAAYTNNAAQQKTIQFEK
jgi:hypothetical protein